MSELAKQIVNRIIKDFIDRRGLRQEWDNIDSDIQDEIKATWLSIVSTEISHLQEKVARLEEELVAYKEAQVKYIERGDHYKAECERLRQDVKVIVDVVRGNKLAKEQP